MITNQTQSLPLFSLLRLIALAPNDAAIIKLASSISALQSCDQLSLSPSISKCFSLARERLKRMENVPLPLKNLVNKIEEKVRETLFISPVLASHLKTIFGDNSFGNSLINDYMTFPAIDCKYSDLFFLIGSDWGGYMGNTVDSATLDASHIFQTFWLTIHYAVSMDIGTQAKLWKKKKLDESLMMVRIKTSDDDDHTAQTKQPNYALLESLKQSKKTLYIPIGYSNVRVFFYHIIAINYGINGFRLRLLTSDNSSLLACGNKLNHYCPEVIWDELDAFDLADATLWNVLLEPETLSYKEVSMPSSHNYEMDAFLGFNSNYIICWLTKKLGKAPQTRLVSIDESYWTQALTEKYHKTTFTAADHVFVDTPKDVEPKALLLKPTGKEIKRTYAPLTIFKFVNLIPLDVLQDHSSMLLFKAESRLMLLTQAYRSLIQDTCTSRIRGQLLRLFEEGWGKVTAPIQRLMKLSPSMEQVQQAKTILNSLLDLKHRLKEFVTDVDKAALTVLKPIYTSTHEPHLLELKHISFNPIRPVVFETLRLHQMAPPLQEFPCLTQENCALFHRELEEWYEILIDSKNKCEPAEIVTIAHKNIFSKLPIPQPNTITDFFPEPLSEGLQVGILGLLRKISSLVASEVYSDNFVPPIFVVDMIQVYRFAVELYRHIDIKVQTLPVSWFCLHEFMESRNSFHLPTDVRKTLDLLVASFKAISPKGHLAPSESFLEIPLFYFSWKEFPLSYTFHRKSLGPLRVGQPPSCEEILQRAEQADSVGLKPEETVDECQKNRVKWENSFGGQCLIMMEEIAQYYTMAAFATTQAHQEALQKKEFLAYLVNPELGPEDHFSLPLTSSSQFTKLSHSFGSDQYKYGTQVIKAELSMNQRMSEFHDKHIKETIENSPIKYVNQFRSQADLIKALPKYSTIRGLYYLHQISSGPSALSIDLLLEYFESHCSLLLNRDYRSYFMAIIRSAHVLESSIKQETLLLKRFKFFIEKIKNEDQPNLHKSALNYERLLWLSALTRHLCRFGHNETSLFAPVLASILKSLQLHTHDTSSEFRLAPHMLASQRFLNENDRLSIVQLAHYHLLVGFNPPAEANDYALWLETSEAMQSEAKRIQSAFLNGNENIRRELWKLILQSDEEVNEIINRKPQKLSLETLAKTSSQLDKLKLKQAYFMQRAEYYKKYHYRENSWLEEAVALGLKKVNQCIKEAAKTIEEKSVPLFKSAQEIALFSETTILIKIKERLITVDWVTGRVTGATLFVASGKRLSIFLRKHRDLAILGPLLRTPLASSPYTGWMLFEEAPAVFIDTTSGAAWLNHQNLLFRLLSKEQRHALNLPDQLTDNMSVWFRETGSKWEGIVAAHNKKGVPFPVYAITSEGIIHPLKGNTKLSLAIKGYYPEAHLFSRWGINQKHILIWLDEEKNVAELHIPYDNGEKTFTRVIKQDDGRWWIDGLDVHIVPIEETIESFAGHPVYLIAENIHRQRLMLLPGATPYEIKQRREKERHEISWNKIHVSGPDEKIHQYRILSEGKIEGLTVADNLLLILWKIKTGDYKSAADLAQRWIAPPGRPYNEIEQKILSSWFNLGYGNPPMQTESHPSALAIRFYVMIRVVRHLKRYPPQGKKGKQLSAFAEKIIGDESYGVRNDFLEHIMTRQLFEMQVRGTEFRNLINIYDQEASLFYLDKDNRKSAATMTRALYQRMGEKIEEQLAGTTLLQLNYHNREIIDHNTQEMSHYSFKKIIRDFPSKAQSNIVPVKALYKHLTTTLLIDFFDKAYILIKNGPQKEGEAEEYQAVVHAVKSLRGQKAKDLCIGFYWIRNAYTQDHIFEDDLLLWLFLEQAYLAKSRNKELPELPSIERRFGLALEGSQDITQKFFNSLAELSGKTPETLLIDYRKEWYKDREMRFINQASAFTDVPENFVSNLQGTFSYLLREQIQIWKTLHAPKKAKENHETVPRFAAWNYPIPLNWEKLPQEELEHCVKEKIQSLKQIKTRRQNELLALANKLPENPHEQLHEFARQIHYGSPHSIDECLGLALAGCEKLILPALLFLEVSVELAHLLRSLHQLEQCQEPEQFLKAKENLLTPHHYLPSMESLPLLISEYYTDCRLRIQPDQAMLIEYLTGESKFKGHVIQAIMGSGKSKMLAPIWLRVMLSRGLIPFLCVPSSLFQTTLSDLQEMMWTRFRVHVRAFTFDREHCTLETLHALAESLYLARLEPTVFVCSPRDLHALQLMLKERHQIISDMRERLKNFTLVWAKANLSPENCRHFERNLKMNWWHSVHNYVSEKLASEFKRWFDSHEKLEKELKPLMEEADILQGILNLLQHEQALLVDEVATSWDPKNLLSFPIGWQVQANQHAVAIGCKLYFEWLVPYYNELNLMNNMQSFTKAAVRQKILQEVAHIAWKEYKEILSDLPDLITFTAYLQSDCKAGGKMERYVFHLHNNQHVLLRQYAQEIAYLKYCLTSGLEGALTSSGHVNYGRSKKDPELYLAIPYQYANVPKENTLFRKPWKTILMTCQLYAQGWTDFKQTAELIGFLQGIDPSSKDVRILEAAVKVWGRGFSDANLVDDKKMQELTDELDRARTNEKSEHARLLISTYLKCCVFPSQLKLDPAQITSSPQDIPMIALKTDAMGGTFGFETTWNTNIARVRDRSSDETIEKALREPRNQKCFMIAKGGAEGLYAFLKERLAQYTALIDCGALFKGMSNEKVAQRLYAIGKDSGFDSILFYDEQKVGDVRLAVMTRNGKLLLESSDKEGVRRAFNQLKLSRPFIFFDHARRIGADLEIKPGRALVTFSDHVTIDDLFQGSMRCRGIIDGRHSIDYAIPSEMEGTWDGNEVIKVARMQQVNVETNSNFHGICDQMRGALRAFIDKKMRSESIFQERHVIHSKAQAFMMEEQVNDLVKAFGSLQEMVNAKEALLNLKEALIKTANTCISGCTQELTEAQDFILKWHQKRCTQIPELIRIGESQDDAVQEVDISKLQENMRQKEEEYERMLGTRNPKTEIEWKSLDHTQISASPIGYPAEGINRPTLYLLREVLNERGFKLPISEDLLISANLLSTFLGEGNSLLTENQKPLHRLLCITQWHGNFKIVLLSEGDANHLKTHLQNIPGQAGKGIYLMEPNGVINQRGCRKEKIVNLWKEGTLHLRHLLLQVLCFQGAALTIDQLPEEEVRNALDLWSEKNSNRLSAIRVLFESVLDLKPEEMIFYRRSKKLRAFFNHINNKK